MTLTNILKGKKYGVVQTVLPISRDFFFPTIVWFQKISIPPPRMVNGNSEGYGGANVNNFPGLSTNDAKRARQTYLNYFDL